MWSKFFLWFLSELREGNVDLFFFCEQLSANDGWFTLSIRVASEMLKIEMTNMLNYRHLTCKIPWGPWLSAWMTITSISDVAKNMYMYFSFLLNLWEWLLIPLIFRLRRDARTTTIETADRSRRTKEICDLSWLKGGLHREEDKL